MSVVCNPGFVVSSAEVATLLCTKRKCATLLKCEWISDFFYFEGFESPTTNFDAAQLRLADLEA